MQLVKIIMLIIFSHLSYVSVCQYSDSTLNIRIKSIVLSIQKSIPHDINYYDSTSRIMFISAVKEKKKLSVKIYILDSFKLSNEYTRKLNSIVIKNLKHLSFKQIVIPIAIRINEMFDKSDIKKLESQIELFRDDNFREIFLSSNNYFTRIHIIYLTKHDSIKLTSPQKTDPF